MNEAQKRHLASLADAEGRITPDGVLKDARRKDSPLHDLFEWNRSKAAKLYWIERARELIRCVKVEIQTSRGPDQVVTLAVPQFVRDPGAAAENRQGYRAITSIRSEPDTAAEAVLAELRLVQSALQRALLVAAALDAEAALTDISNRVERFRQQVAVSKPSPVQSASF